MRVSRNDKLIKRRARLGTYATVAGLVVLVGGMIISFQVQYVYLSLGALLLGFILSQYGSYSLRRWGRSPRPDEQIELALKGFDDRFHLYAWTLPLSPYVLLSPQGVYSFTTRDQTGAISVNGARWSSKFSLGRALTVFAQEGLGNPSREALDQAAAIDKLIKGSLPDTPVKVQPVVVFTDERAQLRVNEPAVPVMLASGLKKWLRGAGKGTTIKNTDYRALEELFDSRSGSDGKR